MRDLKARLEPRIQELRGKYERFLPAAFFIFGLVFDIATTDRIDHWLTLIQQAVYLAIIGTLLIFEVLETRGPLSLPQWLQKAWTYRDEATHFLFGSLLSTFVIFYFKSASILNSFLFLFVIASLLVLNELERFKSMGLLIRFALYSLCLISYFAYLVPILVGFVGLIPFVLAFSLSAGVLLGFYKLLLAKNVARTLLLQRIIKPAAAVQGIVLLLYVFQLIPPVPVSLKYIGIYHQIEKQSGRFALHYERPWWKFWQNGAQTFFARPGDRIYCFAQIFSPTGFKDQVKVRWLYKDKSGWRSWDAIPLDISGGRQEGFRGFTFKQNYQPGEWRVKIETTDGREIGRIGFEVVAAEEATVRELATDFY